MHGYKHRCHFKGRVVSRQKLPTSRFRSFAGLIYPVNAKSTLVLLKTHGVKWPIIQAQGISPKARGLQGMVERHRRFDILLGGPKKEGVEKLGDLDQISLHHL